MRARARRSRSAHESPPGRAGCEPSWGRVAQFRRCACCAIQAGDRIPPVITADGVCRAARTARSARSSRLMPMSAPSGSCRRASAARRAAAPAEGLLEVCRMPTRFGLPGRCTAARRDLAQAATQRRGFLPARWHRRTSPQVPRDRAWCQARSQGQLQSDNRSPVAFQLQGAARN